MFYLFLIIILACFCFLEYVLDNILWIGSILIILIIFGIIYEIRQIIEWGFGFWDIALVALEIGGIIWLNSLIATYGV